MEQYETQKQLTELNLEQYQLEMLYQKAYTSILNKETEPPYQFNFPDGNIYVTAKKDNSHHFLVQLKTNKGSYRELTMHIQK